MAFLTLPRTILFCLSVYSIGFLFPNQSFAQNKTVTLNIHAQRLTGEIVKQAVISVIRTSNNPNNFTANKYSDSAEIIAKSFGREFQTQNLGNGVYQIEVSLQDGNNNFLITVTEGDKQTAVMPFIGLPSDRDSIDIFIAAPQPQMKASPPYRPGQLNCPCCPQRSCRWRRCGCR